MGSETKNRAVPAWIINLEGDLADQQEISDWLVKVMMAGVSEPGFLNAEIIPSSEENGFKVWTLIHRFESVGQAVEWQKAPRLLQIISEHTQTLEQKQIAMSQHVIDEYAPTAHVATAIVSHVTPGKQEEYLRWVTRIHAAQAHMRGYRGTFLQPGGEGGNAPWTTLLRFDSPETLESWFDSAERKELLLAAKNLARFDIHRPSSAFPGWFPFDPVYGREIPRWKTAMLVLSVLYPLIIASNFVLAPVLRAYMWPTLVIFVSNMISCSLIGLLIMPLMTKAFSFWLFAADQAANAKGCVLLFAIYAVEICLATCLTGIQ